MFMKKKMMSVLVAMVIALAFVGAQAADTPKTAALALLRAKSSVDTVSSATKKTKKKTQKKTQKKAKQATQQSMDMQAMPMTPVDDLTPSANPLYPVGAEVVIETDHMSGMQGAKGVVSGAYDTTLYAVDYIASDGMVVKNHRWVIAEEIENSAGKIFAVGDTVTLGQGHMESMGGVGMQAVIAQVVQGPAYMVDYDPADGSARVTNHQWVAEFELGSADSAS
jgi:hypothetical protein